MGAQSRRGSTFTASRRIGSRRPGGSSTSVDPEFSLLDRSFRLFLVAVLCVLFSPFPSFAGGEKGEAAIFLDYLEAGLERFERDYALEEWDYYTTGEPGDLDLFRKVRSEIYGTTALFDRLALYRSGPTGHDDQETARRSEILFRRFLGEQVAGVEEIYSLTDSLSQIQIGYRALFRGVPATNNELMRLLRFEEERSLREEAWRARFGVGNEKAEGLTGLIHLRNREARRLGYSDFYRFRLDVAGIEEEELYSLLYRLHELSAKPYSRFKARLKERIGVDRLEPWDLRFAYDSIREELEEYYPKEALEERIQATFRDLGLDLDSLPITVDGEPRPGKSQHAYSFSIDVPVDVRILFNADRGIASATTLLHETGHAVYSALIGQPHFSLRSPPSKSVSEGVAAFFGRLSEDPEWQARYARVPPEMLERFRGFRREQSAFELRRMLLYIFTERELYRRPEADPNEIYWDLASDLFDVGRHPDVAAWAHKIHYTTHPVYYQNYLLADLIAAHLVRFLRERQGVIVGDPRTGRFFREEIFSHGARHPWNELLERATGEPLRAEYYVEEWLAE